MATVTATASRYDRAGTRSVITQLKDEWGTTFADKPNPWTNRAALASYATLGGILDALDASDSAIGNQIGWDLMNAYWAGDETAARTLVQAMLPRVLRLTRTARMRGFSDPAETTITALWSVIATYPRHRRNVITTLAMDTLCRMGNDDLSARRWQPREVTEHAMEDELFDALKLDMLATWGHDSSSQTERAASEATALLAWAQSEGIISGAKLEVLARVHLADDSPTLAQVAHELGISEVAARKRHSLGIQQLAAAVRDRLAA